MTPQRAKKFHAIQPSDWDLARLGHELDRLVGHRVVVVGDVGVDRYTEGSVERVSDEAPVPIVRVESERLKLGLAANVADNIRALGSHAELCGVVGRDRSADDLKRLLSEIGVSAQGLVTDSARRTALKERIVSVRQQLLRVDYESSHPVSADVEVEVLKVVHSVVSGADAVIVDDYAKGLLTPTLARGVFAEASRAGKPSFSDAHVSRVAEHYSGCTVFKPNRRQTEALSGIKITDEATLFEAGRSLLDKTGARHVVITLGKDGIAVFSAGEVSATLVPTYAREVYDVSGAGDTVLSVISLAMTGGAGIVDASILGNLAAGVVISKRGTATVTVPEIREAMEFFGRKT